MNVKTFAWPLALLLSCPALTVRAEPQQYVFAWRGFEWSNSATSVHAWQPDFTVSGYFIGEDSNADGVLTAAEVSKLHVDGFTVWNCGTPAVVCSASFGHYRPGTDDLAFTASNTTYSGDDWMGQRDFFSRTLVAPVVEEHNTVTGPSFYYTFTPDTKFTISAVPEPSAWLMLGAGLLALRVATRKTSV